MAANHRRLSSSRLRVKTDYDLRLVPLPVEVARWMLGGELGPQPAPLRPESATLRPEPETLRPEPATLRPEPATLRPEPATLRPGPEALRPEPVEGQQPDWHPEYPLPESLDAIALALAAHEAIMGAVNDPPAWWIYQIVVDDVVVGDIGFHGPPGRERTVEIGYSVVPAWRGRGVASRACELILQQGWRDGAEIVLAETDHDNVRSQAVLLSNGFGRGPDGVFVIKRPED